MPMRTWIHILIWGAKECFENKSVGKITPGVGPVNFGECWMPHGPGRGSCIQHKRQEDDEKSWLNFQNRPREDLEVQV